LEEFNKMYYQRSTLSNIQQMAVETTHLLNLWINTPFSPKK
jgi:hypothetical protein